MKKIQEVTLIAKGDGAKESSKIDITQYSVQSWSYHPDQNPTKNFTALYDYYPSFSVTTVLAFSTNIKCVTVRHTNVPEA